MVRKFPEVKPPEFVDFPKSREQKVSLALSGLEKVDVFDVGDGSERLFVLRYAGDTSKAYLRRIDAKTGQYAFVRPNKELIQKVIGSEDEDLSKYSSGKFEIFKDKSGEYRFRLRAGNGQLILASEGYKEAGRALRGISAVKRNALDPGRFEMKETSSGGNYYFVLKAANNQVVGVSQMYESRSGCLGGIESVMNNAPSAIVISQ
ncbi:MAG TPA: YegP family protein [Parvularculaceae bacterium]|nr:YegP family protein [Caulobacterales bacterium]HPE30730.1 YegP family protein [Parvularculaceae bacterium]